MSSTTNQTVYERITGSIIAALEQGVAPWVRPWAVSLPFNAVSRREYHGVNILSCLAHQLEHGHASSAYLTFQQARSLGGWIRQGERGVLLVLYREMPVPVTEQDDEVDDGRRIFLAKGFTVFNVEQTGGLEEFRQKLEDGRAQGFEPLEECERIVRSTGAMIRETGTQASYSPVLGPDHDATSDRASAGRMTGTRRSGTSAPLDWGQAPTQSRSRRKVRRHAVRTGGVGSGVGSLLHGGQSGIEHVTRRQLHRQLAGRLT